MIKRTLLYLCLFAVALYGYRALLYAGLRHNRQGIFHKYNEMFSGRGPRYDVLFMGSSRAEMHFDPRIFDSVTQLNSYNIGISGATPKINFELLKVFCARHQAPRYLVYDIDFYGLKYETDTLSAFPRYFPYLEDKGLRTALSAIDARFPSFYYNPLHSLPYTQVRYLSAAIHGWLNVPGKYDTFCYKGHQAGSPGEGFAYRRQPPGYAYIHPLKRAYIDSVILFAKQHQVQLLLVSSPIFCGGKQHVINKKQLTSQLHDIAVQNGLSYLDETEPAYCYDSRLFVDNHHLNTVGAGLFTRAFSEKFYNICVKSALIQGE